MLRILAADLNGRISKRPLCQVVITKRADLDRDERVLTLRFGKIWYEDSAVGTKLEIVAATFYWIARIGESEEVDVDLIVGPFWIAYHRRDRL